MKNLFFSVLITCMPAFAFSVDIYDEVGEAIRTANAREVSKYFGPSVDMTILTQEGMYSKAQAEVILRDFFSKNTPKTFSILHKGTSKEGSVYAIGNLQTSDGRIFRTYFVIKQIAGKNSIQELRFEQE